VSVAIFSIIPALFYGIKYNFRKALRIFSYNIFYSFSLFWITPYAIFTASRRGWLTRELPNGDNEEPQVNLPAEIGMERVVIPLITSLIIIISKFLWATYHFFEQRNLTQVVIAVLDDPFDIP